MNEIKNIREFVKVKSLDSEYELQKALLLDRKLRLMIKEDESLKPIRKKLRALIKNYEDKYWSDKSKITDKQILDAEKAELDVKNEQEFIKQRKEIILKKLKEYDMNQQELGQLLGHGKTYISELMNGVSKFSLKDLLIIHHVLEIDLKKLIPPFLKNETKQNVKQSILKLNKPKLQNKEKYFHNIE